VQVLAKGIKAYHRTLEVDIHIATAVFVIFVTLTNLSQTNRPYKRPKNLALPTGPQILDLYEL
jgi:hypothetical protein